ncbi:hypothetical protein bAD24_I03695 [Burkholderia sp. AD24]|nr:hypothetical protein bAD24_I03695 [Burkholderia sp. AD24]
MLTLHQFGTRLGSGVACLCLGALCAAPAAAQMDSQTAAQMDAGTPLADTSTCRFVVGQAEIDGVMQQVSGRACLQPDGTWQIVQDDAGALAPAYYYDPWYWGPPVVFGVGVSVIFVDRFHHFHHMDHVRYVHGSYGVGGRGGWHGGSSVHVWSGGAHMGGGMHR